MFRCFATAFFAVGFLLASSQPLAAQSFAPASSTAPTDPSNPGYLQPSNYDQFHRLIQNAIGPGAFAGSAIGGAIDQAADFPSKWGQGMDAYGARVASNLGISVITASAQYSIAEISREDTKYYRCTCSGFLRRFGHAAFSSAFSRRGTDGHYEFSPALTISPFIGPMVAANTWIPSSDGPRLGFRMGYHNYLGQFSQNEVMEFLYGGPNTVLGHIQKQFSKKIRRLGEAENHVVSLPAKTNGVPRSETPFT